jgi:tetratricopeptide (TPR) repeat protein
VEEDAGRAGPAERLYRAALEEARKPRDRRNEGLALRRLGRLAKDRGAVREALHLYARGFDVAEAQGDRTGMVVACQGMGNSHVDAGSWAEAEAWSHRGLALVGEAPSRERWQIESNLSIVARRASRLEESARWLASARATADACGDGVAVAYLLNAEGMLRLAEGQAAAAESLYREAADAAPGPGARATVLINLAECLWIQGRLTESAGVAREVERLAIGHGLRSLLPHAYLWLAEASPEGSADAVVFYEQALELSRAGGNAAEVAEVQRRYARFEVRQGAAPSAAARLREALELFRGCGSVPEMESTTEELERLEKEPT